jgi:hypothetical protein
MDSPAMNIKDILEAESSLALTFASNLFIGREPVDPDTCVTLYDIGGMEPQARLSNNAAYLYEFSNVQVRVRANSYTDAYDLIYAMLSVLHGYGQETVGTAYISAILAKQDPAFLAWDEKDRAIFVNNYSIQRR